MKTFRIFLNLAVFLGAGALAGCHGGPDELNIVSAPAANTVDDINPAPPVLDDTTTVAAASQMEMQQTIKSAVARAVAASGGTMTPAEIAELTERIEANVVRLSMVAAERGAAAVSVITRSAPKKGSITQSSRVSADGETADQIEVDFDTILFQDVSTTTRIELGYYQNVLNLPPHAIINADITNEGDGEQWGDVLDTEGASIRRHTEYSHRRQAEYGLTGTRLEAFYYPPTFEDHETHGLTLMQLKIYSNIESPTLIAANDPLIVNDLNISGNDEVEIVVGNGELIPGPGGFGVHTVLRSGTGYLTNPNGGDRISGTWHCVYPCILNYEEGDNGEISYLLESAEGYTFTADSGNGSGSGTPVELTGGIFSFKSEDIVLVREKAGKEVLVNGTLTCDSVTEIACRWTVNGLSDRGKASRVIAENGVKLTLGTGGGGRFTFKADKDGNKEFVDDDYIVAGLWLRSAITTGTAGGRGINRNDIDSLEFGVFVDGSKELVNIPASGIAKYTGVVGSEVVSDNFLHPFSLWGEAELFANWRTNGISGILSNFGSRYFFSHSKDKNPVFGNRGNNSPRQGKLQLNLNEARFGSDPNDEDTFGFFNDGTVSGTYTRDDFSSDWTGTWGGQFFGDGANTAAGTFAVRGSLNMETYNIPRKEFSFGEGESSIYGFYITDKEPTAVTPVSGIASSEAIDNYINENGETVQTMFGRAAGNDAEIGSITQSSGGAAARVGIDDFTSISAEAAADEDLYPTGAALRSIKIKNYADGANWAEMTEFTGEQVSLKTDNMTLAGKFGTAELAAGTLFMDVYTNIQAPTTYTAPNGLAGFVQGQEIDGNGTRLGGRVFLIGEDGVRGGRAELDGVAGTWSCAGDCTLDYMPNDRVDFTPIKVENYMFTPDSGGNAVAVDTTKEFRLLSEDDLILIREENGIEEAFSGSLNCDGRDSNTRLRCHWTVAEDTGTANAKLTPYSRLGRTAIHLGALTEDNIAYANVKFELDASAESSDADYLTGGVWAYIPGDGGGEFEIGAFADGSAKLRFIAPSGTATYSGAASGLAYSSGDTAHSLASFKANAELTADWGAAKVSGRLHGFAPSSGDQMGAFLSVMPEGLTELILEETDVGNDFTNHDDYGVFQGDTTINSTDSAGYAGRWGGEFYGFNATTAAGTFGVANEAEGKSMVGFFLTEKDEPAQ